MAGEEHGHWRSQAPGRSPGKGAHWGRSLESMDAGEHRGDGARGPVAQTLVASGRLLTRLRPRWRGQGGGDDDDGF